MSQAVQNISTIAELAQCAIAANDLHGRLCDTASLADYARAMTSLAGRRATTAAEFRAKAMALETTLLSTDGQSPTVEGDDGVAASLIRDLLAR